MEPFDRDTRGLTLAKKFDRLAFTRCLYIKTPKRKPIKARQRLQEINSILVCLRGADTFETALFAEFL